MSLPTEILLVEDDPNDVDLTLRVFRNHQLANRIRVFRDGAEVVEYLLPEDRNQPVDVPRFILLDLKLPKISGLDVLRRIRSDERTRTIPVVMLTSSRQIPDIREAYALGVNSYLCKPVEFDAFAEVVRQLGMYWMLLNEPPTS
ncbi:MAG: response regulator [Planctomycetota bacterium]|nr:MAG: response regulator [Planctomycetota bacterium]